MLASGAHGSAVVLLERAHPLAAEADRAAVAESLAVARAEGGDLDGALALADALPPVPARSEAAARRGQIHIDLAWAAVMAERTAEAALQVEAARVLLGPTPPRAAGPRSWWSTAIWRCSPGTGNRTGIRWRPSRPSRRPPRPPRPRGCLWWPAEAWQLLALLRREEGFDAADAALERMLSISTEHSLPVWRVEALVRLGANAFMRTGDASRLLSARAAATDLGALLLTRTVDGLLAMNAVLCARWEEAQEIIDRSAEASARVGDLSAHRYLLLAGATMAAHRGRRRDMDRALAAFRRAGGEQSLLVPLRSGLCRAFGALLEEDRERAAAGLDEALAWELDHPSYYYLSGRYGLRPLLRVLAGQADRAELEEARAAPLPRLEPAVPGAGRRGAAGPAGGPGRGRPDDGVLRPALRALPGRPASGAAAGRGRGPGGRLGRAGGVAADSRGVLLRGRECSRSPPPVGGTAAAGRASASTGAAGTGSRRPCGPVG